jgi:hypothetical protein
MGVWEGLAEGADIGGKSTELTGGRVRLVPLPGVCYATRRPAETAPKKCLPSRICTYIVRNAVLTHSDEAGIRLISI